MAYRAVVFVITVLIAVAAGLFLRRGEVDAASTGRPWPGVRELAAQDVLLRARPQPSPRRDIILVAADDASVEKYGKLPWSREVWGRGLRRVQQGGAKVAVFDINLDTRTTSAADAALWRTMANGRRTVLGMAYDANQTRWTPDDVRSLRFLEKFALADNVILKGQAASQLFPWSYFEPPVSDFTGSARGVGVFLRETDPDAVIRHARLLYLSKVATPETTAPLPGTLPESRLNGFTVAVPSLALAAAAQTFGIDKKFVTVSGDAVRIAGSLKPPVVIPIDSASRMTINYAGPAGTFETVSFTEAVEGGIDANRFKDKIVVFGATAAGAEETDRRLTPYGEMPRAEITANALGSILNRSYLARARGNDVLATLITVGVVAGLLLAQARPLTIFLTGIALLLLYLAVAWGMATFGGMLLPVLPVLLVLTVSTLLAVACAAVFAAQARRVVVERTV